MVVPEGKHQDLGTITRLAFLHGQIHDLEAGMADVSNAVFAGNAPEAMGALASLRNRIDSVLSHAREVTEKRPVERITTKDDIL